MTDPGGGHDSDQGTGERAKDADRIAYGARDGIRHDKTFRVNEGDPANEAGTALSQRGNPGDKEFNKSRKLGG